MDSFAASNGGLGNQVSLQFDAQRRSLDFLQRSGLIELEPARRTGGAWSVDIVDSNTAGTYSSLVLGSDGIPRIAYRGGSPNLRYAVGGNNGWRFRTWMPG